MSTALNVELHPQELESIALFCLLVLVRQCVRQVVHRDNVHIGSVIEYQLQAKLG